MVLNRQGARRWRARRWPLTVSPMTCSARAGRTTRPLALAAIALTALIALGGCGDGPEPKMTHSASPTSSPPSPSPSAWEAKYTPKQMAEFKEALHRYMEFQRLAEPIYSKGKATKASMKLFKEYFLDPDGKQADLELFEKNKIRAVGLARVLWSRPTRIRHGSVRIQQCIDNSTSTIYQDGKKVKNTPPFPYIDSIVLDRPMGGGDFMIEPESVVDPKKARRCHV